MPSEDRRALRVRAVTVGEALRLTIDRNGKQQEVDYTVGTRERTPWTDTPSPAQVRLREAWLTGRG